MAVWTVVKYAVAVLLVGSGCLCFVAAADFNADIPQGDFKYEVTELNETEVPSRVAERLGKKTPARMTESNQTSTPYAPEFSNPVLQYSNLSSSAQTIFLNTLDSGGTYSTDTKPVDFRLNSDINRRNYVGYQNSTYELNVHDIETSRDFDQLFARITMIVGAALTIVGGGAVLWWNRTFLRKQTPF